MKRKVFFGLVLFTVAAVLLAGCQPRTSTPAKPPAATPGSAPQAGAPVSGTEWQKVAEAGQKEGKLSIYASGIQPATVKALSDAFKARYGIAVDWITGQGASNLEKIKTEQASRAYNADLYFAGPGLWVAARDAKVLAPMKELPVTRETGVWRTHPHSFDPQGRLFVLGLDEVPVGGVSYFINSKFVTADKEPKSWQDLLNPQWKGKILMFDPTIGGPGADLMVLLRRGGIVGIDYFEKLAKQNPGFIRGYREQVEAVNSGEYYIGIGDTFGLFAIPLVEAGAPLKKMFPREGVSVPSMSFAQVANAPHPNAARLFVNWALTKEGQETWHTSGKSASLRTDVANYAPSYARLPPETKMLVHTWESLAQEEEEIKAGLAAKIFGVK